MVGRAPEGTRGREDAVGRLGGDEFPIVLPGAGEAAAVAVIERLMAILAAHPFALLATPDDGPPPVVGYSLGIAVAPRDGATLGALLAAADRAMYHARRGFSGAIRSATPASPTPAAVA